MVWIDKEEIGLATQFQVRLLSSKQSEPLDSHPNTRSTRACNEESLWHDDNLDAHINNILESECMPCTPNGILLSCLIHQRNNVKLYRPIYEMHAWLKLGKA